MPLSYRHILVPTDGTLVSGRAEKAAIALGRKFRSKLTAIHVVAPYSPTALGEIRGLGPTPLTREEYEKAAQKRGKAILAKFAARAKRARLKAEVILVTDDSPGDALVRAARKGGCDLIVMGSNSRAGIERIFLGSVASEVLSGIRVPTLVCH